MNPLQKSFHCSLYPFLDTGRSSAFLVVLEGVQKKATRMTSGLENVTCVERWRVV